MLILGSQRFSVLWITRPSEFAVLSFIGSYNKPPKFIPNSGSKTLFETPKDFNLTNVPTSMFPDLSNNKVKSEELLNVYSGIGEVWMIPVKSIYDEIEKLYDENMEEDYGEETEYDIIDTIFDFIDK